MNPILRTHKRPRDRLLYFIRAREEARLRKELVGGPAPHSSDPILSTYRFCNIDREHDAVTKWIKLHVRDKYDAHGKNVLVPQILAARVFNEPATLEAILPILNPPKALQRLRMMRDEGHKIMRGAYMMPVHGHAGLGKNVEAYYMDAIATAQAVDWTKCVSLEGVAERLTVIRGLGDFLANQVCTDLRYTSHWRGAADWQSFVLCGPGSRRGIDRYDAAGVPNDNSVLGMRQQRVYGERILQIREELWGHLSKEVESAFVDINNLSNTFCEFDKFERALWSDKPVSLRKYNP